MLIRLPEFKLKKVQQMPIPSREELYKKMDKDYRTYSLNPSARKTHERECAGEGDTEGQHFLTRKDIILTLRTLF